MKMQTANDENEQMKQLARANEELTNEIAAKDKDLRDMAAGFGVLVSCLRYRDLDFERCFS